MLFVKTRQIRLFNPSAYLHLFEGKPRLLTFDKFMKIVTLTQGLESSIEIISENTLIINKVAEEVISIVVTRTLYDETVSKRKLPRKNLVIKKADVEFSFCFSSTDDKGRDGRVFYIKISAEDYTSFLKKNEFSRRTLIMPISEELINKIFDNENFQISEILANQKEVMGYIFR